MHQSARMLAAARMADNKSDIEERAAGTVVPPSIEDQYLVGQVERALHATGYSPLRAIDVIVCARLVMLSGQVPSFYLKQVAQTAALRVAGIHRIHNKLEVVSWN